MTEDDIATGLNKLAKGFSAIDTERVCLSGRLETVLAESRGISDRLDQLEVKSADLWQTLDAIQRHEDAATIEGSASHV